MGARVESFDPFAGTGEMCRLLRAHDWAATPLGPVRTWPQSLQVTVRIMLGSRYAMWLGWGPDLTFLYNDAYARMTLGPKHPWALGRPARAVWAEIWPEIGPRAERVLATGEATWDEGLLLFVERRGFAEESYHTFSYSPVPDDDGGTGGMLCVVTEDTERTIGERRLKTLRELATQTTDQATSAEEACRAAARILAANPYDLPFTLLYLIGSDGEAVHLVSAAGLPAHDPAAPPLVHLTDPAGAWPFGAVAQTGRTAVVTDVRARLSSTVGVYLEPPHTAAVLPVRKSGQERPAGFLVAGISPRRPLDDAYQGFLDLLAGQVATAVANARAYEEEKKRAEALAELDRAKTAFFSNVSHEFRTPLTLMLGPLEDALAGVDGALSAPQRERLEVAHRNSLRLLKLVNTLLDFSRIEAGRATASYEPTDLAALTADLASNFRSACERAGLELVVDCRPLGEPVYVDRDMWEKVVLNLLSNAFKYTFSGRIEVALARDGARAVLMVRDTGTGIPAEQVPKLFERFHRVEGRGGRTQEGTGIGLALVKELIHLHGGAVWAESELGRGSTFTVALPLGAAHLTPERIIAFRGWAPTTRGAAPFVEEALRWLPSSSDCGSRIAECGLKDSGGASGLLPSDPHSAFRDPQLPRPRVLLADDNADMRDYIHRLLGGQYEVEAVADGRAAREAVRQRAPDLVLSDVMMPGLDGFGLLRELRADPRTQDLPVILLSARAGEEARVEGLRAGADDYLIKPFSARDLLARVDSTLAIARLRREALHRERRLLAEVEEQRNWLRVTLASIGDAVAATDAGGRIVALNPVAEALTGWTEAEARGRPLGAVFVITNEATGEVVENPAARALREGRIVGPTNHTVLTARDGTARAIDDSAAPIRAADGAILGVVLIFRDVTKRKLAEEALREADRRKDEFLATLAHELRNPLAPIRNGLQVMRLAHADRGVVERARAMMERQLGHMVRLVDDLLDLSRISRGKIQLQRERVELALVVQQALETSRPVIEQGGHELTVTVPPEPILVDADTTRLAQVFSNLLNNAAKYTDRGGRIRLAVECRGAEVVVSVQDTGIGIPAPMLPKVFDVFTQVDRNLERAHAGLGIGLSIVKRLVEMHGGTVEAHSAGPGAGSEFVVHLPVAETGGPAPAPAAGEPARSGARRVLVVDDNRDAAESLALVLELMGDEVRTGHDGLEALELAEAFRPQVVLLDIGMPGLNGYEVAQRIRHAPWGKDVVLLALTGWGQEEDRRKSQAAGFDFHLVKPIDPTALEKVLAEVRPRTA
jgi:PAS domain S-box-containing protein